MIQIQIGETGFICQVVGQTQDLENLTHKNKRMIMIQVVVTAENG